MTTRYQVSTNPRERAVLLGSGSMKPTKRSMCRSEARASGLEATRQVSQTYPHTSSDKSHPLWVKVSTQAKLLA